ncbi:MAG TPA: hypothetical protein VGS01_13600 [Candidatus Limnocylindria bacterium]|nr:hypothetical protein [Candidatus Limnocylindria bacterium]
MRVGPVAVAILVVVAVAVLVPNHPAGRVPAEDAGVFFYAAQRLLEGGVPYRDVWDHKPPGVYLVSAVGLALAGRAGVWLVQIAVLLAAVLIGHRALRREFGPTAALVGSIAWLVAVPRLFLEFSQTQFAEFFALPLQFGALLLFARPLMMRRALAIGVLGGLALLLKPTLVAIWLAIGLVMLATGRVAALRPILAVAVGASVPVAVITAWAVARGALADMVDQALVYNSVYSAYSPASERLASIAAGLRLTLPSGLAIVALGAYLYALARRRATTPLLAIALVAFPIELVFASLGRGYHYYFLPWLPTMAVLVAFAVNQLEHHARPRAAGLVLGVGVVLMCLQPTLLVLRLATSTDDGRIRGAAAYVVANTRPDDTVLVWGSSTEILFLAERRAPTRYVYQYGPLATRGYATAARVDEFLADLERARPVLIIDGSAGGFVTPPLDLAGLRAYVSPDAQYEPLAELERVIAFVNANYDRVGIEPATGWPVWRLRGR